MIKNRYILFVLFIVLLFTFPACKTSKDLSGKNKKEAASEKDKSNLTEEQKARYQPIVKKYAAQLNVSENELVNTHLYFFIDDWYGVPYKYGGKSKSGIDCSGFVSELMQSVYTKQVTGSSSGLYTLCSQIDVDKLQEGDLVFLK